MFYVEHRSTPGLRTQAKVEPKFTFAGLGGVGDTFVVIESGCEKVTGALYTVEVSGGEKQKGHPVGLQRDAPNTVLALVYSFLTFLAAGPF